MFVLANRSHAATNDSLSPILDGTGHVERIVHLPRMVFSVLLCSFTAKFQLLASNSW